jgi:hypothetical protein
VPSTSAGNLPLPNAATCGLERVAVKDGLDPSAAQINLAAVQDTTIAALVALVPPVHPGARVPPVETTVYRVSATLVGFKLEDDSDYHAVISDGTQTMIVEFPSPTCVTAGPLHDGIALARSQLDARFHVTHTFQHVSMPVAVTGVGFFDFKHGQTGVAPNAIELHPVLSISFA